MCANLICEQGDFIFITQFLIKSNNNEEPNYVLFIDDLLFNGRVQISLHSLILLK